MSELVALGRYGAGFSLVTRSGEVVDEAQNIVLLFRPAWADHPLLNKKDIRIYDLAELWGFIRPAQAVPPTLLGMLGKKPESAEDSAVLLYELMDELLAEAALKRDEIAPWLSLLKEDENNLWPWLDYLAADAEKVDAPDVLKFIKDIPKWNIGSIEVQSEPKTHPNLRPVQQIYFDALKNHMANESYEPMLAEGGTGVGKTRAYLAAAQELNQPVWVSTFTKNLQQQVQNEAKIHLGLTAHIRKGRDNYTCLKILFSLWEQLKGAKDIRVRVGIVSMMRWALETDDGDLSGASFPGWFTALYGYSVTIGSADKNRDCIYAACPFYFQCYAERARALTNDAPLVVANHAVMAGLRHSGLPPHVIMDEAHHVEHVMDEALTEGFSYSSLMRVSRFLLGQPSGQRRRARRGFLESWQESLPEETQTIFDDIKKAVHILPTIDLLSDRQAASANPFTAYLYQIEQHILQHYEGQSDFAYDLDIDRMDMPPHDKNLLRALQTIIEAMQAFLTKMDFLDRQAIQADPELYEDPRKAILIDLALLPLQTWQTQLLKLGEPISEQFIEWGAIKREEGNFTDVGLFRAWLKPLQTWQNIAQSQHSQIIYTTATPTHNLEELKDIEYVRVASPFDYTNQSKVIILSDINSLDGDEAARAIAQLAQASEGSALAVFTAIARLRQAYAHLSHYTDQTNLNILAQHESQMDVSTLIDLFRSEPRSVLLGTDAIRDGIDIPGDALRLLIYDRVPWSRPTMVYRRRKELLGGRHYEENIVRLKLRQAFGRLIRQESDKGVFVMLDSRLPSRLYDAFPAGVSIEKMTLAEAVQATGAFLKTRGF